MGQEGSEVQRRLWRGAEGVPGWGREEAGSWMVWWVHPCQLPSDAHGADASCTMGTGVSSRTQGAWPGRRPSEGSQALP